MGPAATAIHVGYERACLVGDAQRVWCWGTGEFGDGHNHFRQVTPLEIAALAGIDRLSSPEPRCWLKQGAMACWGYNGGGQLGNGEGGCRYETELCSDCKRLPESTCTRSDGPVAPLDPQVLNAKGSLFLQRPSLNHHILTRDELVHRATEVLGWIQKGELKLRIGATYPLAEAVEAHRALEGRKTTGKVLLLP